MAAREKIVITVSAEINGSIEKVWSHWVDPIHIIHWNYASDDWHTSFAENNFRIGEKFLTRMESRDGSMGFDFNGVYLKIEYHKYIEYAIEDGRKVGITFASKENVTIVTESFEAENSNPPEMQKAGWQAILNNFKKYVEKSPEPDILHFEIIINNNVKSVFRTMIDPKTYSEWTAIFNPTSRFQGSWEKGSKILFLGTDKDGETGGMISRIKENIPGRFLSIEHLGLINKGVEITSGPEADEWAGSLENYTFITYSDRTKLMVDIDSNEQFKSYFEKTWPKALEKLKSICEK